MTMAVWSSDRVCVVVMGNEPPTDEEWGCWIRECRRRAGRDMRVIVEASSGNLDAKRRKELAAATVDIEYRAAVLTDSIVARGVMTALSWMGVPQRGFGAHDHIRAANFLQLTPAEFDLILGELPRLRNAAHPQRVAG